MATTKKRTTAPKPIQKEVKKGNLICCKCGETYTKQAGFFPASKSPLYEGNNGYLPICKNCLKDLYMHYVTTLGSEWKAVERICSKFDMYFSMTIVDGCVSSATDSAVIMTYISRVSLPNYKNKTYDSTIEEDEYEESIKNKEQVTEEEESAARRIIEEGIKTWGVELEANDYRFLDTEFDDWNARCDISGKSRETLVKNLCMVKLMQNKALANKDNDTYTKLCQTYQKDLQAANLTPKQVEETERANEIPLGVLIKKFEDEDPIPQPIPEFKDWSGIQKVVRVYFIGHLMKMLGLKNKYSKEYEEEMASYLPSVGDKIGSDDSEDIYEYLMESGFTLSSDDKSDGDNDGD